MLFIHHHAMFTMKLNWVQWKRRKFSLKHLDQHTIILKNMRGTGTDFLPLISISYEILNGNCELYWPYTICCFFSRYDCSSLVVTNDYQGN